MTRTTKAPEKAKVYLPDPAPAMLARATEFSYILSPRPFDSRAPVIDANNPQDLRRELSQLEGPEGKIQNLEDDLKQIIAKFREIQGRAIDAGNEIPEIMDDGMQEEYQRIAARLEVAKEELTWLNSKLEKALQNQPKPDVQPISAPEFWSISTLKGGQLQAVGGHLVSKNEDGIFCIDDERSQYSGMPVWRFKSEVSNPIHWEYSNRQRAEAAAALEANRPRKAVKFPSVPLYNPETGVIEYQDYMNETMKKLKAK